MIPHALRLCPVLLLLASCSAVAPQSVTQLETMKANAAKGDLQANANAAVSCVASDTGCYQVHLLKGDACYALSRQAQGAARRADDMCAVSELGAGVAQAPGEQTTAGSIRDYAVKRLEALHDLIDTRRAGDPSGADTLAAAAQDFMQRYSNDPAGIYYLASARMTTAQDQFVATQNKPALCAALPGIASLTSQGARSPSSFGPNFAELTATIAGMKKAGGCS
jgi:hypothetical protein